MEYINVKNRYKRKIQLQRRLGTQVLNIDSFQREFELANKKYKGFSDIKGGNMVKISMPLFGHWKKSNPKAYWELFQKKRTINVSLVDLVDHF